MEPISRSQAPTVNTLANDSQSNPDSQEYPGYRSLVIGAGQATLSDFGTKGLVSGASRLAAVVRVGTTDYNLSYKFMNKLRGLIVNAAYRTFSSAANPNSLNPADNFLAVVTPGFFARLKAAATAPAFSAVAPDPAYTSTYTLTASEASFVTLLEAQNAVEMPNYLREDDSVTVEGAGSFFARRNNPGDVTYNYSTQSGLNTLALFYPKTVRKQFFVNLSDYLMQAGNTVSASGFAQVDSYMDTYDVTTGQKTGTYYNAPASTTNGLGGANNSIKNNILSTSVHFYNEGVTPPTGSLFKMDAGTGVSDGLAPATTDVLTTAEKAMLTSILAQAPVARNVLLVNSSNDIVKGNIGIGFNMNEELDTVPPTAVDEFLEDSVAHYGVTNVNSVFPTSTNALPANNADLNGAAAVMLASLITDRAAAETAIGARGAANGGTASFDATNAPQGDVLRAIRALHMEAGSDLGVTPVSSLKFPAAGATTFLTPAAQATPVIQVIDTACPLTNTTSLCSDVEYDFLGFNLFDAFQTQFGNGKVYKLGKTTATGNKNFEAIKRFFHANNPSNAAYVYRTTTLEATEDTQILTRALVVPCTRSINATTGTPNYTFSPTASNYVLIMAQPSGSGDESLNFSLVDPNYYPGEGYRALDISTSNPGLVSALYNYTGTLVGVDGAGF
ncbi:MAG: hypothetical protein ACAI44_33875 [Candidatus Sericytochromatia bacterium]